MVHRYRYKIQFTTWDILREQYQMIVYCEWQHFRPHFCLPVKFSVGRRNLNALTWMEIFVCTLEKKLLITFVANTQIPIITFYLFRTFLTFNLWSSKSISIRSMKFEPVNDDNNVLFCKSFTQFHLVITIYFDTNSDKVATLECSFLVSNDGLKVML